MFIRIWINLKTAVEVGGGGGRGGGKGGVASKKKKVVVTTTLLRIGVVECADSLSEEDIKHKIEGYYGESLLNVTLLNVTPSEIVSEGHHITYFSSVYLKKDRGLAVAETIFQ